MMTAEQLKASILQMAMQGKLVEQRAEEGTGAELLRRLLEEKKNLIKNGQVKPEKAMDVPLDDEQPYDIPETWTWARFGAITFNRDSERIPLSVAERTHLAKYYDYYGASGIIDKVDKYLFDKPLMLIGEDGANLLNRSTPIAFIAKGKYWVNNHAHVIDMSAELCMKFVTAYINSISLAKYVTGTAQPKMNQAKMNSIWVPLPPLEEQKRIVAKIEELMPFVEQYAKASTRLNTLNASFPDQMKKSILQQAVMGKLVPQAPNDEPASMLLKKIAEEKQKLIKEGKIKKQKALPAITEDEIPFDIPERWKWVRLECVTKSITDGDHQAPPQTETGIPFLVISNVSSGFMDFSNTRHVPKEYFEKLSADRKAVKGDILFTVTGSYGIPMKVETEQEFCFQRHIALIKPMIDANFLVMLLKSPLVKDQCDRVATGTAQKTVGLGSLRNILVPIPPKNEQIRILETLKYIIPLAENLN